MIKTIVDFLSGLFRFKFIQEIPFLFLKPRYFFSIIENESTKITFERISFYVLSYNFIFILVRIYLGFSNGENLTFEYLLVTILDLALFALYFTPFLILIKFTSPKISIKTVVSYLICVHLNILLFYFVFYGLFLSTENYAFAILRAISVYSMVPILIFGYPLIFSFNLKNRLKLFLSLFY